MSTGKSEISGLEVKCDYVVNSCTWVGTVGTLEEHVAACPKKLLPCPNGCDSFMEHQYVEEHVATECELTVIPCKYMRLGCDRELKRNDMAAHEEDEKLHLRTAMITTVQKTTNLEREISTLKQKKGIKFKLANYEKYRKAHRFLESPIDYISPNGHLVSIKLSLQGSHVSAYAKFMKGKYDLQLKWPFVGYVTFTLLNQLEDKNHYQMTLSVTDADKIQAGLSCGYDQFIPHSALDYDAVNNTQYLKDDTLHFRMSVEPADQDEPWLQ